MDAAAAVAGAGVPASVGAGDVTVGGTVLVAGGGATDEGATGSDGTGADRRVSSAVAGGALAVAPIVSAAGLGGRGACRSAASSERSAGFSSIGALVGSETGAATGSPRDATGAERIACGPDGAEAGRRAVLSRSVLSE